MFFKRKNLDQANVLGSVKALGQQCTHAWTEASKVIVPENYQNLRNVVMCGMGGSGLGARVIESVYKNVLSVPVVRVNDYHLPEFVNFNTLVIASSYSGNTEETLNNVKEAIAKKAPWVAIGAGGQLLDLAKSEGAPFYQINPTYNPSNEPRMAIGYSVIGQLVLAQKCKLLTFTETELNQLVATMDTVKEADTQKMAKDLINKEIVFVSADFLDGATHVWNNQTNENAKTFSSHVTIPEINHHLLESLKYPSSNRRELVFVFVDSSLYDPAIAKRLAITKEVVSQNKVAVLTFKPQASTRLAQTFEVIQFGAYVSYYLANFYKIDPAPIPWVDYFKKKMVEN